MHPRGQLTREGSRYRKVMWAMCCGLTNKTYLCAGLAPEKLLFLDEGGFKV